MPRKTTAPAPEPILLTVPEAAQLLTIGHKLCWKLIYRGEIPHVKLGRFVRVPRAELLQVIEQRTQRRAS